jgi:hypothetical protein
MPRIGSKTSRDTIKGESPQSSLRLANRPVPFISSIDSELFVNHLKSKSPLIAGLSSFAIHLGILLILAIWTFGRLQDTARHVLIGDSDSQVNGPIEIISVEALNSNDSSDSSDMADSRLAPSLSPSILAPPSLDAPQLDTSSPNTITTITANLIQHAESGNSSGAFLTTSLEGRNKKNRETIGARNGATAASEAAVEAALQYLARHQRPNGSWTMRFEEGPCQGECDHGCLEKDPHEIAATGLALLCFLGAGHTLNDGLYSEQVQRGIYFLRDNLKIRYGRGTWLTEVAGAEMYEHGIATLALCEALQMNEDESLKPTCQAAINHIIYAQHNDGGWDYHPKAPGDLSIVGWQVMALKSAFSAKLDVPPETIRGIDIFLKRTAVGEFMFRYRNAKPTTSMTAIGMLLKIFRGASRTEPSIYKAAEYLAKEGPAERDVYSNYYATQALFQFGGKSWNIWNPQMREFLVNSQDVSGHTAGSWWFPKDTSNERAGRLYVTTMACLTLEVYYRYLPVYDSVENEFKF